MRLLLFVVLGLAACSQGSPPTEGEWHAWFDSPGGELPFGLVLQAPHGQGEPWRARLINGPETIEIPTVEVTQTRLALAIDHYDARVEANTSEDGQRLDGRWIRRSAGADAWSQLPFHATWGAQPAPTGPDRREEIAGRWAVQFETEEHPSVGIFEAGPAALEIWGTFLNTTGDYRYLAGTYVEGELNLSCFDGAHVFLFRARLEDGALRGDFWSRDTWHETWTATRDETAALPDAFALTQWNESVELSTLRFPDLEGNLRALNDPAFGGEARIVYVFGSWCPNCADATRLLVELHDRYAARGLSILGLAFEHTGDFERDARQVRRYAHRHGVEYPLLVAGLSKKELASEALPILDRVRSYPTTIFIDGDGQVRAIHTGFTGPATPEDYLQTRATFSEIVASMLAGAEAGQ